MRSLRELVVSRQSPASIPVATRENAPAAETGGAFLGCIPAFQDGRGLEGLEVAGGFGQRLRMAMAQAVCERLLHVRQLHEVQGGGDIHQPRLRQRCRDRVDELGEPARLLDRKVDALQNLDAVGRIGLRFARSSPSIGSIRSIR